MEATLRLDGETLTLDALGVLADAMPGRLPKVEIAPAAWKRLTQSRAALDALNLDARPYYGINTGFGSLCDVRINQQDVERLQHNLLVSHAVGVGAPVPATIVRLMLALKIQSLVRGHSAVQPRAVELLLELLNRDILPVVPTQGSVGASGDLAPLAHLSLPLIGEGEVDVGGRRMTSEAALREAGLQALRPGAKDGLALINGTQFMAAYGALVLLRAGRLLDVCDAAAALSLEALRGTDAPLDPRIHAARPHPGAGRSAEAMRRLVEGSERVGHAGKVQDPYSLRCAPQVHGASRDALGFVRATLETEFNSTTDNPLLFEDGSVVSGGNFHGQPLALGLDFAAMAIAELASISERRTYLLLEGRSGLPRMLARSSGLNSGLMIAQYTSAALVSENKVLAHPACVDTIPTSLGQEDHVSMGSISGVKALRVLENAEQVVAVELLCAAQALDLQPQMRPGAGAAAIHRFVRAHSASLDNDRYLAPEMSLLAQVVRAGALNAVLKETL